MHAGKILLLEKFRSLLVLSNRSTSYLGKWKCPEGYNTNIEVYNLSAGRKVPLVLKRSGVASWYMCGPTVYAESHMGHACCYIKFDIIRRILENFFNINVILLLGITDIDDKIIQRSKEVKVNALQLAKKYEIDFFQDMDSLKVLAPAAIGRVSENILNIISFCEKLIKQGYAYVTDEGNVYFIVSKSLSADIVHETPQDITDNYIDPKKKDPRDFALWKSAKQNEPFWESPWGRGRPGWHIECSVVASKMFGACLDIHSGGYDLLFPHHSNEKSQSEAYHGCSQWGNYWLHVGLLHSENDEKMSKSLNNTILIKDFLKEHSANDLRILCLQSPYRKNILYNSETLMGAKSLHKKLHNFINECEVFISENSIETSAKDDALFNKLLNTKDNFKRHLANDFNTSQALLCLTEFIDEVNKCFQHSHSDPSSAISNTVVAACYCYVNSVFEMLGVHVVSKKNLSKDFIFFVDSIVELRSNVRLLALNPSNMEINERNCSLLNVVNMYELLKEKLDFISKFQNFPKNMNVLLAATKLFSENSSCFIQELSKDLKKVSSVDSKSLKKKMNPLFKFCDEFRLNLSENGVGVKDRGHKSTWIPLTELYKFL